MLRKGIALAALGLALVSSPALASGGSQAPMKETEFSFEGPFGKFDQAQLQRGYKVYREVCSACHSMNLMYFRNLGQKGGPFYDEKYKNPNDNPYVKAIAAEYQINDVDTETGDTIQRPGVPADKFPSPFANEYAARASNGGALPPDLSVIVKARHHGAHYVYSLLSGYKDPPKGLTASPTQHYNPYFSGDLTPFWKGPHDKVPVGGFIAMPPQLEPDKVTFDDGTKSTIEQQAKDVATFLAWASEPKMEERKRTGFMVMIFLGVLALLLYLVKKKVWADVH